MSRNPRMMENILNIYICCAVGVHYKKDDKFLSYGNGCGTHTELQFVMGWEETREPKL